MADTSPEGKGKPVSFADLVDDLADHLDLSHAERPQPIRPPQRPTRRDAWPAEEWALMQRIYRGEED